MYLIPDLLLDNGPKFYAASYPTPSVIKVIELDIECFSFCLKFWKAFNFWSSQ